MDHIKFLMNFRVQLKRSTKKLLRDVRYDKTHLGRVHPIDRPVCTLVRRNKNRRIRPTVRHRSGLMIAITIYRSRQVTRDDSRTSFAPNETSNSVPELTS